MFSTRKAGLGLAVLLGLVAAGSVRVAPARADDAVNAALANIDKAIATLNDMQALNRSIDARHAQEAASAATAASTTASTSPAETGTGKIYTVVLRGSMCANCAGKLSSALASVDGVKVVTPPQKGTGRNGTTLAWIQMDNNGHVRALRQAVTNADTPHKDQVKPGLTYIIPAKLKADTKPADITKAFRDAGLMENNRLKMGTTGEQEADALRKANLVAE